MNAPKNDAILPEFEDSDRDSLSARFELETIVNILKARFSDYSDETPSLEPLSSALDLKTLREIFNLACRAATFNAFCDQLDALWASRDAKTKEVDEKQRLELVTAQIFNNFVVQILEKRRRIGASFLRRYVGEISPKIARELDFDAYSTEPTVHIFGAQVSRLCDLVFTIPYKDRSKGAQAVAVPMEHKSTQTRNVVFQLLTSLVLVLQYILRHKERYRRNDKKFVWPFLLLFYTGARPWKKVLNFPDLFATSDETLDKRWIFKLPFKFVSLFTRSKRQTESDPWLDAFLELTKAAERIVAQKDATSEDWKKAWNDALKILEEKLGADDEEGAEIFGDFFIFVTKVAVRKGWDEPTYGDITRKLYELGGGKMTNRVYNINSFKELLEYLAEKELKQEGEREGVRNMLEKCIKLRFPRVAQSTLDGILSIADSKILDSIFSVACTADSLDSFQKNIRGIAPNY